MSHAVTPQLSTRQRTAIEAAKAPPLKSAAQVAHEKNAAEWEAFHNKCTQREKDVAAQRKREQEQREAQRKQTEERRRKLADLEMARVAREMLFSEFGLSNDEVQEVMSDLTPADAKDISATRVYFLCQRIQERRANDHFGPVNDAVLPR
jgi:hypothetical protein